MIRRILVPLDGSELAEGVLPWVEDLARRLPTEVHFLQVVGLPADLQLVDLGGQAIVDTGLLEEELDAQAKEAEDYLRRLATAWQSRGIETRWHMVRGPAAISIIEFARSSDADLIAMSTHGRSGLGRLVFGSVADQVLREAGTPVLLVKAADKKKAA